MTATPEALSDSPAKPSAVPEPTGCRPSCAMILAAGLGKRMRPFTEKTPKALMKVDGRTLIDRVLDRLEEEKGLETVVINLHHLGEAIERHLERRKSPKIVFSREKTLLETGGGVAKALPQLGTEPFFVIGGDVLWLNSQGSILKRLAKAWDADKMDGLLLLHNTVDAHGYDGDGDFCLDPMGLVLPRPERELSPYVFTGIQILHPRLFENAPEGPFRLRALYDRTIEAERLYGIVHDGEWFHIGSPDGLSEAEAFMREPYAGVKRRGQGGPP